MATLRTQLTEAFLDVDGVELERSRYRDEDAFFVAGREIAHFESARCVDLRLTRKVIGQMGAELQADPRITLRPGASDWLEVTFRTREHLARAVELFRRAVAANG